MGTDAASRDEWSIHRATRADRDALVAVLARAFDADPVAEYLLRKDDKHLGLELMFGAFVDHVILPKGEAWLATGAGANVAGAALWAPPGRWDVGLLRGARMVPALARSVGLRAIHSARASKTVQDKHPKAPHWYLFAIGVDPALQGRGVGAALLRRGLERCDADKSPAYLEASTENSSRLYERHAFRTTEIHHMSSHAPPLWLMWRPPQ